MDYDSYFKVTDKVVKSWMGIKSNKHYIEVLGKALYMRLLEIDPETRKMYSFSKNGESIEDVAMHPALMRQARLFLMNLDMAVDTFGADMDVFEASLEDLGVRHIKFGVLPKHYPAMGEALLWALQKNFPHYMKPKAVEAWTLMYQFLSTAMIRGAMRAMKENNANAKKIDNPIKDKPNGQRNNKVVPDKSFVGNETKNIKSRNINDSKHNNDKVEQKSSIQQAAHKKLLKIFKRK